MSKVTVNVINMNIKGIIIRNVHVKYESPTPNGSKGT